ncbi:MAG: carbohydrate ABC transporter permease [Peptostreptococcaceae bacterium]
MQKTSVEVNNSNNKNKKLLLSATSKAKIKKTLVHAVLIFSVIVILLPLLVTIFASFKTRQQIGTEFPLLPPGDMNLENYKVAFTEGNFLQGFKNSMILVVVGVIINTVIGTTTAYIIGRFNFKFKTAVVGLFMISMVVPAVLTEITRFNLISKLGIYNTILAPIIIYASTDALQLYVYMQFLEKIPVSLDESARIDGCGYFGTFFKVIFPLLLPATVTLAIIKTVWIINDMYIPYLYMPSSKLQTLTTTLMKFSSGRFASWENLSAAIVLVALPTILLFIFLQKYIFEGIVAGAVKE